MIGTWINSKGLPAAWFCEELLYSRETDFWSANSEESEEMGFVTQWMTSPQSRKE